MPTSAKLRFCAVLTILVLVGAACGDDSTMDVGEGDPREPTVSLMPDGDADVLLPSGEGGLEALFATGDAAAGPAEESISVAPCDGEDCDQVDTSDDGADEPFAPRDQDRAFCAKLAEFEQRETPDFESEQGLAILQSWLAELAGVAPEDIHGELERFVHSFGVLLEMSQAMGQVDIDELDAVLVQQIERDGMQLEDFTQWACFGNGDFTPVEPEDPKIQSYCGHWEALQESLATIDGPAAALGALLEWMDELEAASIVPSPVSDDFDAVHEWYDSVVDEIPAEDLFGNEDEYAPQAVSDAAARLGEWSDDACQDQ